MFKRAVFTDEVSQDFKKAVDVAVEYKLDGLEIRSVWEKPPQNITPDDVKKMQGTMAGTGLKVCCIASPFFKCDIASDEEYKQHIEILKNCIRLAHAFDCKIVRGFTFWRKGSPDEHWQMILDKFEEPVRILESEDIVLGIENESSTYIGTGVVLKRFLGELRSRHIGSIWDPCNVIFDDLVKEVPFPDGYNAIKDKMVHVHLKDAMRDKATGKPFCTKIGEGEIDFKGQFQALLADKYEGYVSLETHWRPKSLSEDEMNRPGGSNFSKDGEFASRVCLDNWNKLMKTVK